MLCQTMQHNMIPPLCTVFCHVYYILKYFSHLSYKPDCLLMKFVVSYYCHYCYQHFVFLFRRVEHGLFDDAIAVAQ